MAGHPEQSHGHIKINALAAISDRDGEPRHYHSALPLKELPKATTRRLSRFEKCVIACVMGLGEELGDIPMVLGSRYGTVASNTLQLLKQLNGEDVLSPTRFSLSVHNASVGLASQLMKIHADYSAIAAGARTLNALYTEALARLRDGADQLIIIYADTHLTEEYAPFNTIDHEYYFAALISPNGQADANATEFTALLRASDLDGVFALFDAMEKGVPA